MQFSAGWFSDWWVAGQKFDVSSNYFSSRITSLISTNQDGSRYLHARVSGRYSGASNGAIQLKGKPE